MVSQSAIVTQRHVLLFPVLIERLTAPLIQVPLLQRYRPPATYISAVLQLIVALLRRREQIRPPPALPRRSRSRARRGQVLLVLRPGTVRTLRVIHRLRRHKLAHIVILRLHDQRLLRGAETARYRRRRGRPLVVRVPEGRLHRLLGLTVEVVAGGGQRVHLSAVQGQRVVAVTGRGHGLREAVVGRRRGGGRRQPGAGEGTEMVAWGRRARVRWS